MKLYISDLSLYLLALVWLPFVAWVLWKLMRSPRLHGWRKAMGVVVVLDLAYVIPLGDVTVNSFAMNRVCKGAGEHIYRTVAVDGYLETGYPNRENIERFGYGYSESRFYDGVVTRCERRDNGEIDCFTVETPESRYELASGEFGGSRQYGVNDVLMYVIRDIRTEEVLADRVVFYVQHGWLDRVLLNRLFGASLPGCTGNATTEVSAWIQKVLPPKNDNGTMIKE